MAEFIGLRRDWKVVQIDVAAIPLFAVGDVFVDRRLVPSRPDPRAAASICELPEVGRTIRLTFDTVAFGFRPSGERQPRAFGSRLDRIPATASIDLLRSHYPLTAASSRVLPLRIGGGRILAPAAELFRTLVAPMPKLASALFAEPLDVALPRMVRSQDGPPSAGAPFTMSLADGFDESEARPLANLIEAYNPVGAASAQRIAPSLLGAGVNPSDDGPTTTHGGVAEGAVPMPICFPFGRGLMTIKALCLVLPGGDALLGKFTGGHWPTCHPLDVTVRRRKVDASLKPVPRRRAMPSPRADGTAGGDTHELVEPPGVGGERVKVEVERPSWEGLPAMSVRVETDTRSPTTTVPGGQFRSDRTSFGMPVPGGEHRQGVADHSGLPTPARFVKTLAMLDRLVDGGVLLLHESVTPSGIPAIDLVPRRHGDVIAWAFSKEDRRPWARPRPVGGERSPRSLLVRRLTLLDHRVAYWVSIDGITDVYSALLLTFGEVRRPPFRPPSAETGAADLWHALDRLADAKGRVTNPTKFAALIPGGRATATTCRHLSKAISPAEVTPIQEELDEAAAWKALRRILP